MNFTPGSSIRPSDGRCASANHWLQLAASHALHYVWRMPENRTELSAGRLLLPDEWEVRLEVSCLEPRGVGLAVPLAGKAAGKTKRANLVVSRRPTDRDAAACLKALLEDLATTCRGLKLVDEGEQESVAGVGMPYATVSFEVDGTHVLQRYWIRVDQGTVTQLTGTVEHSDAAKLDGPLTQLALSFEPPG